MIKNKLLTSTYYVVTSYQIFYELYYEIGRLEMWYIKI